MNWEFDAQRGREVAKDRGGTRLAFAGDREGDGELMDEFIRTVAEVVDEAAVERALVDAAGRLLGRSSARFVPLSQRGLVTGREAAVVAARPGARIWGWLVVEESGGVFGVWAGVVRRRLKTLGRIAAETLDRLAENFRVDPPASVPSEAVSSGPRVHDETFLLAVLPLFFNQAERHSEPLAMLCAEVDRLDGIRALLGAEQADRTTRAVGDEFAARIRSCDFAARLDDGRIAVVLPRTEIDGALAVAGALRRGVAEKASLLSAAPGLTVSIGAASYPSAASDPAELRAAAVAALFEAHAFGGDRAEPAPQRSLHHRASGI